MRAQRRRTPVANCRASHTTSLAAASSRSVGPGKPHPRVTLLPSNSSASQAWADLSLLTYSDPVLTAAAMSTRRSCIRPTEHIAPRPRYTCQASQSKSSSIRDVRRFEAEQISDTNPQNGRLSSISRKKLTSSSTRYFFVDRFALLLNNISIKFPHSRERRWNDVAATK